MKSYAASIGEPVINWQGILNQLIEDPSLIELFDENNPRASSYKTCPCGQLSEFIERKVQNDYLAPSRPTDSVLGDLGQEFYSSYRDKNFESALNILKLINLRGDFLVKDLIKKTAAETEEKKKELAALEEKLKALME
jgi:hypothetical protein